MEFNRYGRQDLLYYAIRTDDVRDEQIVHYLVDHGANVNSTGYIRGRGHSTSLFEAVASGNIQIIQCLVEHGANINNDVLIGAIRRGNVPVVTYLVAHGADVNAYDCPLSIAVQVSSLEVVRHLVAHGANVNGNGAYCPLRAAAYAGKEDIVRFLVEQGACLLERASCDALMYSHYAIWSYLHGLLEREEQERQERELAQQRAREEAERQRRERELEQIRRREQEERERRDREVAVHRSWLSQHMISVSNLHDVSLAFLAGSLDDVMSRYQAEDNASKRRRWEIVRDGLEGLLPPENKQRLEHLSDEYRYTSLARIFHPDKVQTIRPDLVPYTDCIFKVLNQAYSTRS